MTMTATEAPAIRLLAGYHALGRVAGLRDHLDQYGPMPPTDAAVPTRLELIRTVEEAGLTSRGGDPVPTTRTLRAAASGGTVIVDAVDGEPASGKDRLLLTIAPHLVLDGAALAAYAVGAGEIVVHLQATGTTATDTTATGTEAAIAERHRAGLTTVPIRVHRAPEAYDEPALVADAETLAHIALIARYGPEWFRSYGTAEAPGTALFTVSGSVVHPGVVEAPLGTSVGELLRMAGGPSEPVQALLTGGYGGAWLPPALLNVPATPSLFASAGATLGPGVVVALPSRACGLAESARVLAWLAARQGRVIANGRPCVHDLSAIAEDFAALAAGGGGPQFHQRLGRRLSVTPGGDACHHPDGSTRFAASALKIFEDHLRVHETPDGCVAARRPGVLPLPRSR